MGRRIEITKRIKSSDHEKLSVSKAISYEDEVRFYINDQQYIAGTICHDRKFSIEYGEDADTEENELNMNMNLNLSSYLGNLRNCLSKDMLKERTPVGKVLAFGCLIIAIICIHIILHVESLLIWVLAITTAFYLEKFMMIMLLENNDTSPALKSKHSAAHMIINFLEKNRKLPRSLKEIKESSRFCRDCGSRKSVEEIVEIFVRDICVVSVVTIIYTNHYISQFYKNAVCQIVILFLIWYFVLKITNELIKRYKHQYEFIISPIQLLASMLVQCVNTTKKVKYEDILLTYWVAERWMQEVYPEFYQDDENYL